MAWIRVIDETDADETLRDAIESVRGRRGKLSNIMAVHSLHPDAMRAHLDLYLTIMFGSSRLSREEREMVAVAVSVANRCPYCITHHAEALRHGSSSASVEELVRGCDPAGLSPRQRALLAYARGLTERPGDVTEDDVVALREAGLSDDEILGVNLIVAYFNFVNRIALGLGVEASDEEIVGYRV